TVASSYFRVVLMDFADDIPEDAQFDSVNLVLTPNAGRYFYGDTTKNQKIYVHRVTEEIEPKDLLPLIGLNNIPVYVTSAAIFSDQKVDYDATELGSLTFAPRVNSIDTLSIRLSNVFGQELFDKINSGHADVSSNVNFQQYLKGLTLVPDDQNTAILGL